MTDLTIKSFVDDDKMSDDLVVTEATLTDCMMKQPGLLAYYGSQWNLSCQQLAQFKRIFDLGEARLYDMAVEHFAQVGFDAAKVTEGKIKSWMRSQAIYSKLGGKLDAAVFEEARAKVAYEAIKERRRMLNDYGNYRRDEMRSGVGTPVKSPASMAQRRADFANARVGIATGKVGTGDEV